MAPLPLALILSAAIFHALWNRTLKSTGDRVATMAIASLGGSVILLPGILLSPPRGVWLLIALSALAETFYAIFLSAAYKRGALSVAYPLGRGTAPLLVTLAGWAVLAEPPGPVAIAGAAALALGMAIIAGAAHRAGQGMAVGFALLTGIAIASYSTVDARAVQRVSPPGYLGVVLFFTGVLLVIVLRGDRQRLQASLRPGIFVAFGSVAAYLLVLLAFQRAAAGRIATLREVSVLIGIWLSGEKPGRRVWLGAVFVVAGIFLAAI